MKKGGRLIITEYILEEQDLSSEENGLLAAWLNGWEMPRLESATSYYRMLAKSGFQRAEISDWTEHMMPSLARLGSLGNKFKRIAPLLSALRVVNSNQRGNLSAVEAQMEVLKRDAWRYKVVTAVKS